MKNNKFIKATSIVMSAVVAGMAMGSGACYAEQTTKQTKLDKAPTKLDTAKTKLDEAKKRVKSTTSRVVKDGRKFVNKDPNRDMSLLTAGFFTATAIVSGAAYYGYPNGLADLAKHIVKVEFEEGKQAKLLALRLKGYKFEDGKTADALLLISTEPDKVPEKYSDTPIEPAFVDEEGKASWVSRVMGWISQKVKPSYDGKDLEANKVYRVTPGIESAFKQWMTESISKFGPEKASGKLEFVPIDASHIFGYERSIEEDVVGYEEAKAIIDHIEGSAKSDEPEPEDEDEDGDGVEEKVEEKVEVQATLYAYDEIEAGKAMNDQVRVKTAQGKGAVKLVARLVNYVKEKIDKDGKVEVKFMVKSSEYNSESKKVTFADGSGVIEGAELVKEEKKA